MDPQYNSDKYQMDMQRSYLHKHVQNKKDAKLFEPYREYFQYRSNACFIAYTSTGLEYIHLRI